MQESVFAGRDGDHNKQKTLSSEVTTIATFRIPGIRIKFDHLLLIIAFSLMFCIEGIAQNNPNEDQGLKPYDTFSGGDLDSVSMTNGGLSLHIPLASFPQRGNLGLSFMISFSNKQWYIKPPKYSTDGTTLLSPAQWAPMPNSGVQIVGSTDWWLNSCTTTETSDPDNPGMLLYDWSDSVSSPDGSSHLFGDQGATLSGEAFPVRSLDGTGLLRPDAQTLILSNGTHYSYPRGVNCTLSNARIRGGVQASSVTDANGNQITVTSSGWTDTMGRFIPGSASTAVQGISPGITTTDLSKCPSGTASARVWNVPGISTINSGMRTFYFCYSMFPLSNSTSGAASYGPVSTSLLSAVVLPDLTQWTFTYDSYGDVQHVSFPTGGSLAYTYSTGPFGSNTGTGYSTWVMSRTVDANDGAGGHQWTYNYQGNFPTGNGSSVYPYSAKGIATITDPNGNDVVYTIGPGGTGGCPGYIYQTQYFQGRSDSVTLLNTVQTQYFCTMGAAGGDLDEIALNVVPVQTTTIWPQGQAAKVVNRFDPTFNDPNGQAVHVGSLLQKDEYDFSNALVRSTLNRYWWQDNSTFFNNNFVSPLEWTTVYNGAAPQSSTLPACSFTSVPACISQAKFAYDEGTRASSGIGTPTHVATPAGDTMRGNLTTMSRWLDSAQAFVSSSSTYFDTGMLNSSTDPMGRVTTYSYSPVLMGAFVTQTSFPDTQMPDSGAPVVHHLISGNYDLNTGLLTSFTDENSQTFTYTYDIMLRLTEGDHPDGGVTKMLYPDSNTIERQRLISGTTYDDYKVKFDGLGRVYHTLQLTPDCPTYIKVDSTYDAVGRIKTVSNPYCFTTEATYGITQLDYDGVGRVTTTTKPDQSVAIVLYNDTPGDSSGPPAICTTAIDESGKKRQSCTDAFGRVVKVVEPNPGAAATFATGSFSVSGTEQSATSQQAQYASVTLTIGGSDPVNIITTCSPTCHSHNVLDTSGTLNFTITTGGTTIGPVSATYNTTITPAGLAAALYSAFPANSLVTISNPNGGTSFTLTSATAGSFANAYVIATSKITSCVDSDSVFCGGGGGGWTMTLSGPGLAQTQASPENFTGGQNASTVADSGLITATINGIQYSTSFGAGDTSATIASRLATAISAGPYASATPSGGTVNLLSKTAGTIGDYSLTTSYTWNSAQFVNPSFTTSATESALTGAKDASALNNNPFVTTYQYNARGDLLCVHQKATDTVNADLPCTNPTPPAVPAAWRQRFFTYDSLSRISSAINPETNSTGSTTITYTYDNNSNVTSKTEPAPNQAWGSAQMVTIDYTYDALNRLLDTTYVGTSTQSSSHRYDYSTYLGQSFTNPIGREVAATASGNTIEFFLSYDPMGHITKRTQCNPGVTACQTFTAAYNTVGDITSITYPVNNFTVSYSYDSAARLTSATDSNGVIYAQSPSFWAIGAIKEFASPNFNNNKFHVDLNNRLEPVEIWAGAGQGASALFDKQYSYTPSPQTHTNNGNILTISNVTDSSRSQVFTYDALNRLASATDNVHWGNTYGYDAWGNLQKAPMGSLSGENLQHAGDTDNHLTGYSYDAAGNMLNDGINSFTYSYDAENRIITAGPTTYTYDADGRRVKKSTGINYWYGPTGAVLAETDSNGAWTFYIFFAGQRLARNVPQPSPSPADIKYYISDHLHSTAMFVDKAGTSAAILDDNDFTPWGGLVSGVGKSTSDNTLKFTGKYRDPESQLDYFGARYYSSALGRWMRPDRPFSDQTAVNPQSWNLYVYAQNNPINATDPDGRQVLWDIVAQAAAQLSGLNPGNTFTYVFLGVRSGEPGYENTLTAQDIPNWSGQFGMGNLSIGPNGNTIELPNNGSWLNGLMQTPNQDQIDTFNYIHDNLVPPGVQEDAMSHSNGVNALGVVADEDGVTFGSTLVIAPATKSTDTMDSVASASDHFTIVAPLGNSDDKLSLGHFPNADFWASAYPGNVVGVETSCHGAQCYNAAVNAVVVSPLNDDGRAKRISGMNNYSQYLLMSAAAEELACIPCQVAPFFQ
ncbi:MAG: hypothetical protein LAO76_02095 [Acidobacteriia bacterium]|nr:hypothetical protein [Terriglobia bacterium]